MMVFGTIHRDSCPVCNSNVFRNKWKIPYIKIDPIEIRKHSLEYVSAYDARVEYHYSECVGCKSVFLDPFTPTEDLAGNKDVIEKIENKSDWAGFEYRHNLIMKNIKIEEYGVMLDACCGGAESIRIMAEKKIPWQRMVGIDINRFAINKLKELGFEVYRQSVCDMITQIEPHTVDLCIFAEALEHVLSVYKAIGNISTLLKSGGWLYMTAQAIGGDLFINPKEYVATNEKAIESLLKTFGIETTKIIQPKDSCGKYVFFGQKQ